MKRSLALASAVIFALCLTGCGDTHESLTKETLSTMKDMASTLEGIKDQASAKAAKPKLKSISEKMEKINERQSKLKPPTEAEIKAMDAKYSKDMEETSKRIMKETFRIAFNPQIQAELNDIDMSKMPK